jgi:hypothetical protein
MTAQSTDMLGISRKYVVVTTEFKTYSYLDGTNEREQNWTTREGPATSRSRECETVDIESFPFSKLICSPWVEFNTTYESIWFSSSYATTSENEVKWLLGTSTYEKLTTTKYGSLWLDTTDTWVETDTDLIPYSTEIKTTTDSVKVMSEGKTTASTITKVARVSESFIPTYTFIYQTFRQGEDSIWGFNTTEAGTSSHFSSEVSTTKWSNGYSYTETFTSIKPYFPTPLNFISKQVAEGGKSFFITGTNGIVSICSEIEWSPPETSVGNHNNVGTEMIKYAVAGWSPNTENGGDKWVASQNFMYSYSSYSIDMANPNVLMGFNVLSSLNSRYTWVTQTSSNIHVTVETNEVINIGTIRGKTQDSYYGSSVVSSDQLIPYATYKELSYEGWTRDSDNTSTFVDEKLTAHEADVPTTTKSALIVQSKGSSYRNIPFGYPRDASSSRTETMWSYPNQIISTSSLNEVVFTYSKARTKFTTTFYDKVDLAGRFMGKSSNTEVTGDHTYYRVVTQDNGNTYKELVTPMCGTGEVGLVDSSQRENNAVAITYPEVKTTSASVVGKIYGSLKLPLYAFQSSRNEELTSAYPVGHSHTNAFIITDSKVVGGASGARHDQGKMGSLYLTNRKPVGFFTFTTSSVEVYENGAIGTSFFMDGGSETYNESSSRTAPETSTLTLDRSFTSLFRHTSSFTYDHFDEWAGNYGSWLTSTSTNDNYGWLDQLTGISFVKNIKSRDKNSEYTSTFVDWIKSISESSNEDYVKTLRTTSKYGEDGRMGEVYDITKTIVGSSYTLAWSDEKAVGKDLSTLAHQTNLFQTKNAVGSIRNGSYQCMGGYNYNGEPLSYLLIPINEGDTIQTAISTAHESVDWADFVCGKSDDFDGTDITLVRGKPFTTETHGVLNLVNDSQVAPVEAKIPQSTMQGSGYLNDSNFKQPVFISSNSGAFPLPNGALLGDGVWYNGSIRGEGYYYARIGYSDYKISDYPD